MVLRFSDEKANIISYMLVRELNNDSGATGSNHKHGVVWKRLYILL